VFCGKKPKGKNNEHIIPRWLIEFTGDPNRVVQIGPIWNVKTSTLELKEFAFDQFQFPACETCNQKYSNLEIKAKDVVQRLIGEKALSSEDFIILLDWMDKIRVGLWLAFNYLQKNISDVEPNYHISKRIGTKDRAIFLYKSDSKETGITFSGANTPAFQYYPVCFNLRINQFCLFNLSTDFVVSKYLGLPYSREMYFTEGQEMTHVINEGKNRVLYPLVRMPYNKKCMEIYQPIFSHHGLRGQVEHLYDTVYARSLSRDFQEGIGKVLITQKNQIAEYPSGDSESWIPKNVWKLTDLMDMIGRQVLEFQIYFLNRDGNYNEVRLEKRKVIKHQHDVAKYVNRLFLKNMDEE